MLAVPRPLLTRVPVTDSFTLRLPAIGGVESD
jgi:hypothetical protein